MFSWHANLIAVKRRKTLVLINEKNNYSLILYGLKARDWKNLDELILLAIQETFQEECIKEDVIEAFLQNLKDMRSLI